MIDDNGSGCDSSTGLMGSSLLSFLLEREGFLLLFLLLLLLLLLFFLVLGVVLVPFPLVGVPAVDGGMLLLLLLFLLEAYPTRV